MDNPELGFSTSFEIFSMFRGILILIFLGLPAISPAQIRRFDREVERRLEQSGRVCACVDLKDPCQPGDGLDARCRKIAALQDRLISRFSAQVSAPFPEPAPGTNFSGWIQVRHRFRFSPGLVLEVRDAAALEVLKKAAEVEAVELDHAGSGGLNESRLLIRANEVFDLGIKGAGRVVAVLDSGVDSDHPALQDAIAYQYHFLNQGFDQGTGAEDGHGHGTNVTGIIASRGAGAPREVPRGIAPACSIIAIKVLDDTNRGWVSDWTAGFEHILQLHRGEVPGVPAIPIDAINMSLVTDAEYDSACDSSFRNLSNACKAAIDLGIAVFASSGNTGSTVNMTSPACISSVFSVGSVTDISGVISTFTSRNQHLDLLAPGQVITSTGIGGGTSSFQGTSQASPHAAALACLLREVQPDLAPGEILQVLKETGIPVKDSIGGLTFPRIDCLSAVESVVLAVTDLSCTLESNPRHLMVVWSPVKGVESTSLEIRRDGSPFSQETLAAGASSVSFAPPLAGTYQICLTRNFLGMAGTPACCTVEVPEPAAAPTFLRSDCNADGQTDVTDALRLLDRLFIGQFQPPPCLNACDSNGDGELDVSDAVYALLYLYVGSSAPPPPPFPKCGVDPALSPEQGLAVCEMPTCIQN